MAKILIPTPLRPYTDKQDAVDASGATVGELLADLTRQAFRPQGASVQRAGKAAQLRQRLRERRRHPVSAEGADAGQRQRHRQHHSVGRGRRRYRRQTYAESDLGRMRRAPDQRRSQALLAASDHAGGRRRRSAQAQGVEGALHRRRRTRIARGDVSRRRRRRHARHRRLRRRRFQQPAAADPARHAGRRPFEAGVGEGQAARAQSRNRHRDLRSGACRPRTR